MVNGEFDTRVYFAPGDLVKVRHEIENVPVMFVVEKTTRNLRNRETGDIETMFLGIKCRWFDKNGVLQEATFSTKDLEKV